MSWDPKDTSFLCVNAPPTQVAIVLALFVCKGFVDRVGWRSAMNVLCGGCGSLALDWISGESKGSTRNRGVVCCAFYYGILQLGFKRSAAPLE